MAEDKEKLQGLLDDLIAKAPESLRPLATQYGPVLVSWSYDELWAWINLLLLGKWEEAQRALLKRLSNGDLLAEFQSINVKMAEANIENAAQRNLLREAATAILRGVLSLALVLVGL